MAKVMLVEDDNNLREIYEARLAAEGYEIVSAHDGEEALALAVKERPDLIISDVMMPKVSGFDMLDILRSTPETRDTKVIMMTALSQAEDRARADKLGADKYLVKSQVTLEDVVRVAHEVLEGASATPAATPDAPATETPSTPASPATDPATPPSDPTTPVATVPPSEPVMPVVDAPASDSAAVDATPTNVTVVEPPTPAVDAPEPEIPAVVDAPTESTDNPEPEMSDTTEPSTPDSEPDSTPAPAAPFSPEDTPELPTPNTNTVTPAEPVTPPEEPTTDPVSVDNPEVPTTSKETPPEPATPAVDPIPTTNAEQQIQDFLANSAASSAPAAETPETPVSDTAAEPESTSIKIPIVEPTPEPTTPEVNSNNQTEPPKQKKIIQPIGDVSAPTVDLNALLAKEEASQTSETPVASGIITPSTDMPKQDNSVDPNAISL
jgi:CheY-like chemotaxis protein